MQQRAVFYTSVQLFTNENHRVLKGMWLSMFVQNLQSLQVNCGHYTQNEHSLEQGL